MTMNKVITRFPPSPTGEIHIGNMRTMLFNYLYAKHFGGEVFLRFEDTDLERSKKEYEPVVIDNLNVLGIKFDHGPFRQSERSDLYKIKLVELIEKGLAYEAENSKSGNGKVIRYKNPNKLVKFCDKVRGDISIDSRMFGDFVIARNIDNPIYHFAVVVDDMDMEVTHIIRGEDHITSTPRQILLLEALGGKIPTYAHLPLIVGEDNKKLSKRHGATSVSGFLSKGYLPEAIVNYLAFLGWNPGGEREIYSLKELIELFTLEKVGKNPARFNYDKLDDINYQYMIKLDDEQYTKNVHKFLDESSRNFFEDNKEISKKIIDTVLKTRLKKFSDITEMIKDGDLEYFFKKPIIDLKTVPFKSNDLTKTRDDLIKTRKVLISIPNKDWVVDTIKRELNVLCSEYGTGNILHPLRTILSGKKQSPDPYTLSFVLGKEETVSRIDDYLNL